MIRTTRRLGCRLSRPLILLAAVFCGFYLLIHGHPRSLYPLLDEYAGGKLLQLSKLPSANSTLGFGAIAAVSRTNSTRRNGLLLAASITELDITIPDQPSWTDADIQAVKARKGSILNRGSALAWLGHLNMLRWFLSTELETVLILEDDVDWDIHLRRNQIPRVAATVRHLTSRKRFGATQEVLPDPASAGGYWGRTEDWDILYLGHCGDAIKPGKWNFRVQRASFYDSTMLPRKMMERKTKKLLRSIGLPNNVRVVHQSVQPLCTFGFALTRTAARKLLDEIATKETEGGTPAYDVRVLEACRDHGLRCWSSTPELFHHIHVQSEIAIANGNSTTTAKTSTKATKPRSKATAAASHSKSSKGTSRRGKSFNSEDDDDDDDDDDDENEDDDEAESRALDRPEPLTQDKRPTPLPQPAPGDDAAQNPIQPPGTPTGSQTDKGKKAKGPRRSADKAPNIACGARWFKARNRAEMEKLREVVGRQGRCIKQQQTGQ